MDAAPRPAPQPGRVAEASSVLLVALGVLLGAAVFAGGGSRDDALATVGIAGVACSVLALGLALRGRLPHARLDRIGWIVVGASAALTVWTGLSIVWSIAGDRSWEWLGRGVVYLAFLALGLLCGAAADGARRVAAILSVVIGAALAWALLGVAIPSLAEEGDRIARLQEPVGFWNALALLADGAVGLGLWVMGGRRLAYRLLGGLLVYAAVLALLLTQSRAGVVAGICVVALSLVLSEERLAATLRLGVALLPALAVGGWAFTRPALVESGALRVDRVSDGRIFAVLALAGGLVVVAVLWRAPLDRLAAERERTSRTAIALGCVLMVLIGSLGLAAAVGNPFSWASSQLSGGECVNDPGRLTDLCANNRLDWWGDALDIAADSPLGGSGAGTFELARKRYRDDATQVGEPHSVPLQLLADTGLVGLALGLLVAAGAALGIRRGLRLARERERPAAVALTCFVLAYGIHALVDYDLDFIAVTAPALVALGTLLVVGREPSAARVGAPGLLALTATALAAFAALALPALAERDTERALDAADAGRIGEAVDTAERARRLNPVSPAPLLALAVAAAAAGDEATAVAWYEEATRLQPENPDVWFELGLYHAIATGDQCAAYQALNHSYTLDPNSRRWSPGGVLDIARDAVNEGACE
jgi:O-antigen ligase